MANRTVNERKTGIDTYIDEFNEQIEVFTLVLVNDVVGHGV